MLHRDLGRALMTAIAEGLRCLAAGRRLRNMLKRSPPVEPVAPSVVELRRALDVEHLRSIVYQLAEPRNREDCATAMARAERLVLDEFCAAGWPTEVRPFTAESKRRYAATGPQAAVARAVAGVNVVARKTGLAGCGALVVGAHLDSVTASPGADDNGSGIAALIGIARLLATCSLQHDIVLVAFDMEEIGFLGASAFLDGEADPASIAGAIVFESIGYVSYQAESQSLPPGVGLLYPMPSRLIHRRRNVGDWTLVVHKRISERLSSTFAASLAVLIGPSLVIDIVEPADFLLLGGLLKRLPVVRHFARSDHLPFWSAGVPAIEVTNTANFRNPHYHQPSDRPDTLDYGRIADIAAATAHTLLMEDRVCHL